LILAAVKTIVRRDLLLALRRREFRRALRTASFDVLECLGHQILGWVALWHFFEQV